MQQGVYCLQKLDILVSRSGASKGARYVFFGFFLYTTFPFSFFLPQFLIPLTPSPRHYLAIGSTPTSATLQTNTQTFVLISSFRKMLILTHVLPVITQMDAPNVLLHVTNPQNKSPC